ncbi:MAG: hypothetical protein ACR2OB_00680 [Solirubrobacteraceae bacterium]
MNPNPDPHSAHRSLSQTGPGVDLVDWVGAGEVAHPPLHVCPTCASELVQPIAWRKAPADRWGLTLRCPNCAWAIDGEYGQDQVQRLEERLDQGLSAMLNDLARLVQANLADQMDRFATALQAGLILPEDF